MNVTQTLTRRNQTFAARHFRPGLSIMPSLRTMIIGCVDPRVDPLEVLGLQPGEAAVIRNVGGRITPGTLQTVVMLQEVARAHGAKPGGRFNLIVLHHTDCGIAALEDHPGMLADYFGIEPSQLANKAVNDPQAAVAVDVAALRNNPHLPPDWAVSGLVYDVHTGRAELVVP
jgi:carbonic anhydrase